MRIQIEHPGQADVLALLVKLDAYLGALYPAESNHLLDIESLLREDVCFMVARDDAGTALGCAAIVSHDGYAELKRMFVDPARRGAGAARALLAALANRAREAGLACLRLETGIHQPQAIALYRGAGFSECAPCGGYLPDPLSVFMEKTL
ncbi:MAG: GNAT family N-acetyltransferase [Massilia sp.]